VVSVLDRSIQDDMAAHGFSMRSTAHKHHILTVVICWLSVKFCEMIRKLTNESTRRWHWQLLATALRCLEPTASIGGLTSYSRCDYYLCALLLSLRMAVMFTPTFGIESFARTGISFWIAIKLVYILNSNTMFIFAMEDILLQIF